MNEIRGRNSTKDYLRTSNQNRPESKPQTLSPSVRRRSRPSSLSRSEHDSDSEIEFEPTYLDSPEQELKPSYVEESATYRSDEFRSVSQSSGFGVVISQLVLITLFIVCLYMVLASQSNLVKEDNKRIEVEKGPVHRNCTFDKLQKKYPTQDDKLWGTLRVGVEGIINKENPSPAVYLLLKDNEATNLVKDVAQRASYCFDPESKPFEIKIEDFSSEQAMENVGNIVKLYKNKMGEGGVTIIVNLNKIPPKTVRALHFICDTYEPIVNKAIIFLTLTTTVKEGKPIQIAEKILREIWSSELGYHELDPLITRVTDQVILLKPF